MSNTALITGSTGGLGSCFVKIHAEKGGDLILVGTNKDKLASQKKEAEEKYNVHAEYIVADLSDAKQVENIYNASIIILLSSGNDPKSLKKSLTPPFETENKCWKSCISYIAR